MPIILDDRDFSTRGYVAPTVYLRAGKLLPRYNYYATFAQAAAKWKYLQGLGGSDETPVGDHEFVPNGQAQTLGINIDFYQYRNGSWLPVSYSTLRSMKSFPPIIFRMYTTLGNGPFYAIYSASYFGISATVISNVSADKLAALDSFHREVALMKYRYNALVSFLNILASRQLTAAEQQIFNEGVLLSQNMNNEIGSVDGIEIVYSRDGRIGFPVIFLIAAILILAAATAWTISEILIEREKTKRINDSYELNKWVIQKKVDIAQLATSGQITQQQANQINNNLDQVQDMAIQQAKKASEPNKGLFGNVADIVKWGAIGYVAYLFATSKRSNNA